MRIFLVQDFAGNVYITDERDALPSDATDFHEVYLPEKDRHHGFDRTMSVDIQDYSEIISIDRSPSHG